jgi:hypothetical protein
LTDNRLPDLLTESDYMKKTSLLLALPALAISGLLLSGCGMFRTHKAWDTAQQESPLDRPAVSAALVIPPPGANTPTADGVTAGAPSSQILDSFVQADSVDATYQLVGKVLSSGELGQLVSHDDAAHTYTFTVSDAVAQQKKKRSLFHPFGGSGDSAKVAAGASHQVQISIGSSGTNASEVQVQGNPGVVPRTIDALKASLKKVAKGG